MKKNKGISALIIMLIFSVFIYGCGDKKAVENGKVNVEVSINSLRKIVEFIGGDKVNINSVVGDSGDAHHFEPKTKDLKNIEKSDIFIYNGLNMEEWVEKTLSNIKNDKLQVIKASERVDGIKLEGDIDDPHMWLSIVEVQKSAEDIKNALIKADEKNKEYYEENLKSFKEELNGLYKEYKEKFDSLKNKEFVTGHEAFNYLCRDFSLKSESLQGVFAEGEPSSKKLKELIDFCKEKNVKVIFMEEMVSPKVSETLAKEVGAKVVEIDTLEAYTEGKTYVEIMKENLQKIYEGLNLK